MCLYSFVACLKLRCFCDIPLWFYQDTLIVPYYIRATCMVARQPTTIDVKHAGFAYAHTVKNCTYSMCFVSVSISCSISIMESLTPIMVYVLLDFSTHQNSSDKCLYSCTLIASYVPDYNLFIDHLLDLSLCIQ